MGCKPAKISKREFKIKHSKTKPNHCSTGIGLDTSMLVVERKRLLEERYEKLKQISYGATSIVYLVRDRISSENRALKVIQKENNDELLSNGVLREMEVLFLVDHPAIVRLHEFYEDKKFFYLILELCEGNELLDNISNGKKMTERQAAATMRQIFSAVSHMHSLHIVHRDLKPENILINTDGSLTLIDFGTAIIFRDVHTPLDDLCGTVAYMAPEVFTRCYNEKCDIWSCGVILYMLLSGSAPFFGSPEETAIRIQRGRYSLDKTLFSDISKEAIDLLCHLLQRKPDDRPSASEVMSCPWLSEASIPRFAHSKLILENADFFKNPILKLIGLFVSVNSN